MVGFRDRVFRYVIRNCTVLQALEAGSSAALPEGVKGELERLEENGGVRHLSELADQIKVCAAVNPFIWAAKP